MFVFRIDSSPHRDFWRLNRCCCLASLLKKKREILFCVDDDKKLVNFLKERKLHYCLFENFKKLKKQSFKSMLFDLKFFTKEDINFLKWAKKNGVKTIQITDLGLNQQDVDFIIDASIEKLSSYDKEKQTLLGPDYVILHHKYRHFKKIKREYREGIKKIFIFMGEKTQYRELRKIIDLFCRHDYDLKIFSGHCIRKSNQKVLKRIYPSIKFAGEAETLARSFFESEITLLYDGDAAYKAACTGTPFVYLYSDKRQEFIANSFEKHGAGLKIEVKKYVNLIEHLGSLTFEKRVKMGNKGKKLVDAMGAYRIINFFEEKGII